MFLFLKQNPNIDELLLPDCEIDDNLFYTLLFGLKGTSIKILNLYRNQITKLECINLILKTNIQHIFLSKNQIRSIKTNKEKTLYDIINEQKIVHFDIGKNPITNFKQFKRISTLIKYYTTLNGITSNVTNRLPPLECLKILPENEKKSILHILAKT